MTGFASTKGQWGSYSWGWELRSVNSKGLDLRLRVPDWVAGLEAGLRARLGKAVTRGSVTVSLRLTREDGAGALTVNEGQLEAVLNALLKVEQRALDMGLSLAPSRAADIISQRSVLDSSAENEDTEALKSMLLKDFEPLLTDFLSMRQTEGAALRDVIAIQLDSIAALTDQAAGVLDDRREAQAVALKSALERVMANTNSVEEDRIAQELALIAVKADITEELDRLRAHVDAARDLLDANGAVGRKFDFLAQEFNREANTLCSKSQSKPLTAVGLELKAVIDQMREQIQNIE
ncbi:YicC/YloC family endoribonuclease [Alisedimentitalea sp. MJ-SS2]|uniref:YicC/YloC family endoribonuclease n=1 Tax=Aliisedimentitalea sp. MJ-SS2 TaxID=3049795 RepID=UPI00290D1D09|nr:YicC/YloC family endoribonuclease [Alisedimentitalea sp. MJ-SS2]MDU8926921.1 YicC/YloC family endoribonuclease [Alisedimentitalea sp. MJ-SS2]